MSKHTPGPWVARGGGYTQVMGGNPEFLVADCSCDRDYRQEDLANARLIAAAPDLLEMAHAFLEYLKDDSRSERRRAECLEQVISAISKATGE